MAGVALAAVRAGPAPPLTCPERRGKHSISSPQVREMQVRHFPWFPPGLVASYRDLCLRCNALLRQRLVAAPFLKVSRRIKRNWQGDSDLTLPFSQFDMPWLCVYN